MVNEGIEELIERLYAQTHAISVSVLRRNPEMSGTKPWTLVVEGGDASGSGYGMTLTEAVADYEAKLKTAAQKTDTALCLARAAIRPSP